MAHAKPKINKQPVLVSVVNPVSIRDESHDESLLNFPVTDLYFYYYHFIVLNFNFDLINFRFRLTPVILRFLNEPLAQHHASQKLLFV